MRQHRCSRGLSSHVQAESSVPLPGKKILEPSKTPKTLSGLTLRVLAGSALGALGATCIISGGLPFLAFIEFFVYQSIQEYFGFVSLVGVREGRPPPPAWATALVTLCCMSMPVYSYLTGGKIAVALALACFVTCSVLVTTTENPKMSILSSTVFGLLYCGARAARALCMRVATLRTHVRGMLVHAHLQPTRAGVIVQPKGGPRVPHPPAEYPIVAPVARRRERTSDPGRARVSTCCLS
jgi:hypothetical protein